MNTERETYAMRRYREETERLNAATERMLEPRYTYHRDLDESHVKHNGHE